MIIMVSFHGLQWLSHMIFGYRGLKFTVDIMNYLLLNSVRLAGIFYVRRGVRITAADAPAIIVSNHQSMFDISPLIWYLRVIHPKFIAKKELGRGFPGISYNLRHGGSTLIDRSDRSAAVEKIKAMGRYIVEKKRAVVIYPEGTRSDSPIPRKWKTAGLQTLIEEAPNAKIIPVTIKGSWKILQYKGWPLPFGSRIELIVHDVIERGEMPIPELIEKIRSIIEEPLGLKQPG